MEESWEAVFDNNYYCRDFQGSTLTLKPPLSRRLLIRLLYFPFLEDGKRPLPDKILMVNGIIYSSPNILTLGRILAYHSPLFYFLKTMRCFFLTLFFFSLFSAIIF